MNPIHLTGSYTIILNDCQATNRLWVIHTLHWLSLMNILAFYYTAKQFCSSCCLANHIGFSFVLNPPCSQACRHVCNSSHVLKRNRTPPFWILHNLENSHAVPEPGEGNHYCHCQLCLLIYLLLGYEFAHFIYTAGK